MIYSMLMDVQGRRMQAGCVGGPHFTAHLLWMAARRRESSSSSLLDANPLVYHKVCLAGVPSVGKTSFFLRVKTGKFPDAQTVSTNGVDTFRITRRVNGAKVGVSY